MVSSFILPNFSSRCCKYPLHYHRKGDAIALASDKWYRSGFSHFTPEQEACLSVLRAGNLCAHIYDEADEQHLRASCDLMHLVFLYGDLTDDIASESNKLIADCLANIFKDPLTHTKPPKNENDKPIVKLTKEEVFILYLLCLLPLICLPQFLDSLLTRRCTWLSISFC
jgi:alpha-muurolene/germacrene-A/gamma-muurolene synthase